MTPEPTPTPAAVKPPVNPELKGDPKPNETPPAAAADGKEYDELGYEIVPEKKDEPKPSDKKPDAKPPEKKADDTKVENPSTGYGDEPPKDETPAPAAKPEEKKDVDLGFELKIDAIIPKEAVTKVKEFAKANEMTQKQTQALVDILKTDTESTNKAIADAKAAADQELKATRSKWHKELKEDPTFGGENFKHNVHQAERVLQDLMPETKKELTKRGTVLPPYVMRDLAKIAEKFYATTSLVQGDPQPPTEKKNETESDDPLAFYQ